jgi:hypothetical protein
MTDRRFAVRPTGRRLFAAPDVGHNSSKVGMTPPPAEVRAPMRPFSAPSTVRVGLPLALSTALALAGCTYTRSGPAQDHLAFFGVTEPSANVVHVCHAYGCQKKTRVRFTPTDLVEVGTLMTRTRKADTAAEERRAVAYAIGWIERRVGDTIGTSKDRAGMDFGASGDPTQQDCVDESTNTTSYLMMLEANGFLRHHTVARPFARDQLWRGVAGWTHWTAVLQEKASAQRWAVDSWIYANGENPAIVETENWYVADLDSLPKRLQ